MYNRNSGNSAWPDGHVLPGESTDCGVVSISIAEAIDFAARYDPQPFHLTEAGALDSVFGRLTASGLHSGAISRRQVLQCVFSNLDYRGSPGIIRMQMHKPIIPDMTVRVTYLTESIETPSDLPGLSLVKGTTSTHDKDGNLIMTLEDLTWIGPGDRSKCRNSLGPSDHPAVTRYLGEVDVESFAEQPGFAEFSDGPVFFEDCNAGVKFVSNQFIVDPNDCLKFHGQFDGGGLTTEWLAVCLNLRSSSDQFWLRTANAGGPGIERVRLLSSIEPNDVLVGATTILSSRPLKSRPHLGMVVARSMTYNQKKQVVCCFDVYTFIRLRKFQ